MCDPLAPAAERDDGAPGEARHPAEIVGTVPAHAMMPRPASGAPRVLAGSREPSDMS